MAFSVVFICGNLLLVFVCDVWWFDTWMCSFLFKNVKLFLDNWLMVMSFCFVG